MQQEGVRYLAGRERGRAGTCPPQGTGGMRSRSSPGRHPEQGAARAFPRGCSRAQPRSPSRASRTDPSPPVKTPLWTLWDGSRRCLGGVWLQILWKNPLEHAVPQFPHLRTAAAMLPHPHQALRDPFTKPAHYPSSNPPFPCQGKLQRVLSSRRKLLQPGRWGLGSAQLGSAQLGSPGVPSPPHAALSWFFSPQPRDRYLKRS